MLVLTRQRDQTIMIGDDIEITIVDVRGDRVRIGIAAPQSVRVYRKEIYNAIQRDREAAEREGGGESAESAESGNGNGNGNGRGEAG